MKRRLALLFAFVFLFTGCHGPAKGTVPTETFVTPTESTTVPESEAPETEPTETTVPELQAPEPEDDGFVRICDYIPDIRQALPYATTDNFTKQQIYDFSDAWLRYGTVKKLARVSKELAEQGLGLLIWDGFRPVSAQFRLWQVCPDPTYVANPETGFSSHSRGNTVDLTLVDKNGDLLEMPTGFDDFSALADRDYSDCAETAAANARLLQEVMEKYGFSGYYGEWWHFSDTDPYPVEEVFTPVSPEWYYADCKEFISLRTGPDTSAEVITRIPVNEEFQILAIHGDFALVDYGGLQGYVLRSYTQPMKTETAPTLWAANCEEYISLRKTAGGSEVLAKIPAGETFALQSWKGKYARVTYGGLEGYVLTSYITPLETALLPTLSPTAAYSYEQMLADLERLCAAYPDLAVTDSIGSSEEGRDIPVLRIGRTDARYHVLLQGAIHGREHMTAWLLMALADYWLGQGMEGLTDVCWHIIPMSNPDGVAISQSGETDTALWKANGLGVDLNRNFPAGWELIDGQDAPASQQYKGEAPFSAAEARALRDYTLSHDFAVTISYHASGSVIYWEYGDKQPVNDDSLSLAKAVSKVTGYPPEGSSGLDAGGYKDWAMDSLGIPSLTIEVGCGDAPLEEREIYSVFARNRDVLPAIAQWLILILN